MAAEPVLEPVGYIRSDVTVGIVHVGVGAFHRSHQAAYVDRLLAKDPRWGICGVNLRPQDRPHFSALQQQEGMYVLKTMASDDTSKYKEIGSIVEMVDASDNYSNAVAHAGGENIRIITVTVTESGYYLDSKNKLKTDHPDIKQALEHPSKEGTSIYSFLHHVINKRIAENGKPLTVLSCDNLRDNGGKIGIGLKQYLEEVKDVAALSWVTHNMTFPCSMVDRITPQLKNEHVEDVCKRFNKPEDTIVVMSERFTQWVIEDNFAPNTKPPLDKVGVTIVDKAKVVQYEEAKIRILNGGHSALAYQAALRGYKTFDQGMQDQELRQFLRDYETKEVITVIPNAEELQLSDYFETIDSRFRNRNLGDFIERICLDGLAKLQTFVLPTVTDNLSKGNTIKYAFRAIASWFVFCSALLGVNGVTVDTLKKDFKYVDPNWTLVADVVKEGSDKFVSSTELWGDLPKVYPKEFSDALAQEIKNF